LQITIQGLVNVLNAVTHGWRPSYFTVV